MNSKAARSISTVVGIAAAVGIATVGISAGSAGAAPGDPITTGTGTLTVPASTVLGGAASGVIAIPTSPATASYDQTNSNAVYTFPVSGGDGTVSGFFGSVNYAGGLYVADYKTHKAVTLNNLSLSLSDNTISVTPSGSTTPVVLLDANGSHTTSRDRTTGEQIFTSSDVQLDAAGASYLDHALKTTVFVAGQHVGSFSTDFTNTQY